MVGKLHHMSLPAPILKRGFWLYVWKVELPLGGLVHYVGMTGDISGVAQSAANRVSAHIGSNNHNNALRRNLCNRRGAILEECQSFDFYAFGPVYPYQAESPDYLAQRTKVANLEKRLWRGLAAAQYTMLNKMPSGDNSFDMGRWTDVVSAFQVPFPDLESN